VKKLIDEYKGSAGEAIIDYAACACCLRAGHRRPELAKVGLKEGRTKTRDQETVNTLRSRGTRGFRYDSEREHSSHGTVG